MEKLKLDFQQFGNAEVLTRSQLKKIMGGVGGSGDGYVRYGTCIGSSGCWTYTGEVSWEDCLSDIETYCRSGEGTCSINYVCY